MGDEIDNGVDDAVSAAAATSTADATTRNNNNNLSPASSPSSESLHSHDNEDHREVEAAADSSAKHLNLFNKSMVASSAAGKRPSSVSRCLRIK